MLECLRRVTFFARAKKVTKESPLKKTDGFLKNLSFITGVYEGLPGAALPFPPAAIYQFTLLRQHSGRPSIALTTTANTLQEYSASVSILGPN